MNAATSESAMCDRLGSGVGMHKLVQLMQSHRTDAMTGEAIDQHRCMHATLY